MVNDGVEDARAVGELVEDERRNVRARGTDDELRQRLEVLQKIFDHMPAMVNLVDGDGRIVLVNRAWEQTLGWTFEEIRDGRSDVFAAAYPDPQYRQRVLRFLQTSNGEWLDLETRTNDGRMINTSWAIVHLADGMHIGIGQDVTARKQAEEKLRQRESELSEAQRLAQIGNWNWDLRTNSVTWSDELYDMFGVRPQDFSPTFDRCLQRVHPDDREQVRTATDDALQRRGPLDHHVRIIRSDGAVRVLHSRANVCCDESGRPVRWFGAVQDVTERRLREEQLGHQLVLIEAISKSLGEGVYAVDQNARLTFMNPAAEVALGWTQAELVGRKMHDLLHFQEMDGTPKPAESCPLLAVLKTGQTANAENDVLTRKDGTVFPVAYTSSPITIGGRVAGAVVAFHDISERKRTEAMLQTFSQRVIQAQEAERRRVARELHDEIGQALTAVKINLKTVELSAHPSTLAAQLEESTAIIDHALQRVQDLSLTLRPSLLDDLGLVVALRWYVDREARRAGIQSHIHLDALETRLAPELETACFRIMQEALTNVIRHARATRVWVQLTHRGTHLYLAIRDDGVGFDVSAARASGAANTHLGLQGMQERASIVGGSLEVASGAGSGTEVHASFPVGAHRAADARGDGID